MVTVLHYPGTYAPHTHADTPTHRHTDTTGLPHTHTHGHPLQEPLLIEVCGWLGRAGLPFHANQTRPPHSILTQYMSRSTTGSNTGHSLPPPDRCSAVERVADQQHTSSTLIKLPLVTTSLANKSLRGQAPLKHAGHAWEVSWAGLTGVGTAIHNRYIRASSMAAGSETSGRPQHCQPRLFGRSEPHLVYCCWQASRDSWSSQELSVSLPTPLLLVQAAGGVGCQGPDWPTREWTSSL